MSESPRCRHCQTPLTESFCDLGLSPLANSYVEPEAAGQGEMFYPLHAYVCSACLLVQLEEFESPDNIFSDYAYFSSYSTSWLAHARRYVEDMCAGYGIGASSQVVEIASNDGYLLQYFVEKGVPVLGVEPAANVAEVAIGKGIPTEVGFFGVELASKLVASGRRADLLLGKNVLAHVPDINDFVAGIATLLADDGFVTMEFPHLLRLMQQRQFDTIYHEHFSYLSLLAVQRIFAHHGLTVFDVDQVPTHGGSLRVFARRAASTRWPLSPRVDALLTEERAAGLGAIEGYQGFGAEVQTVKRELLRFLIDAREAGRTVAAYGAPAKGNTLLNYCGVRTDLIEYTVDISPHKHGRFLPGTRIPIHHPDHLAETKPDYVLILPWNLTEEIVTSMAHVRDWGGRFVVPIPSLRVLD